MAIPQRGLGFANPERKRAMMLAQLNGSTAVPPPGIPTGPMGPVDPPMGPSSPTSAPPPAQVAPLPMPNMPMMGPGGRPSPADVAPLPNEALGQTAAPQQQPQEAAPQAEADGKTPKWARIAGALGHIILSADAGYHGRAMPQYNDPAKAEQEEAEQLAEFLINTTARAWEISRRAPPGQRENMLGQFEAAIKRVAPDFDFAGMIASLESDGDKIDRVAPQIAMMSPEAKQMFMSALGANGGDGEAAAALLKDDKFMKTLTDFEDSRNAAPIRYKMAAIKQGMDKLGLAEEDLADLTPENFEALNSSLPEKARLSPSEIATLRRNPRLGAALGIRAPEEEQGTLDSRAGVDRRVQPEPGAAASSPTTSRPAPASPQRARPAQPPASGRPQAKPQRPQARAPGRKPEDEPNYVPPGDGPVYTRPGYRPELADPAVQREVKKEAAKRGLSRDQVEGAIGASGQKPAAKRQQKPAPQQASSPKRFSAPRDMVIPGVGKVKKGDVVMYDEATGKYSR